ncbi:hypothetical protein BJ741DRAFT_589879 [Chytriomyces cf. hyalinus JEL632]|nr:hypothetical protein BJ741DRAFT_589879 [Chytriomyces cf. hyalinus JEL632]
MAAAVPSPPTTTTTTTTTRTPALTTKKNVCGNCGTTVASSWRKHVGVWNELLCNSCSVYWRMKGVHRPREMRKDVIRGSHIRRGSVVDSKPGGSRGDVRGAGRATSDVTGRGRPVTGVGMARKAGGTGLKWQGATQPEDYRCVLKRLDVTLSIELDAMFTHNAQTYFESIAGHAKAVTSGSNLTAPPHSPNAAAVILSADASNISFEKKSAEEVFNPQIANSMLSSGDHYLRAGVAPAESNSESCSTMNTSVSTLIEPDGRNAEPFESVEPQPALIATSVVCSERAANASDMAFMIPPSLLLKYTFWVFEELGRLGISI